MTALSSAPRSGRLGLRILNRHSRSASERESSFFLRSAKRLARSVKISINQDRYVYQFICFSRINREGKQKKTGIGRYSPEIIAEALISLLEVKNG
jgi:hypothetical protein